MPVGLFEGADDLLAFDFVQCKRSAVATRRSDRNVAVSVHCGAVTSVAVAARADELRRAIAVGKGW